MNSRQPAIKLGAVLLAVLLIALATSSSCTSPSEVAVAEGPVEGDIRPDHGLQFADDFSAPQLDNSRWVRTKQHDFSEEAVEVVGGRLRMAAATVDTDPQTVKFHGVRSRKAVVDISGDVRVEFLLDWNDQANGCYMRAGIYLCPAVSQNPREEQRWLRMIYVGVPPGRTGRAWLSASMAGNERAIMTENWPDDRAGRAIGTQRVAIVLEGDTLTVTENGEVTHSAPRPDLGFERAYLYLQHSSHSNYGLREVFFDDIRVVSADAG
jgi:hypothetical protein